jgi:hypothetical protein
MTRCISPSGEYFFAVIVDHRDEKERIRVAAPANRLRNRRPVTTKGQEDDVADADEIGPAHRERHPYLESHPPLQELNVAPRKAESWMVAALAASMKLTGKR